MRAAHTDDDDDDDVCFVTVGPQDPCARESKKKELQHSPQVLMLMMTLGGAVCPVRNETDNTFYKTVAAKRAVDFETVAWDSSWSDLYFIYAVIHALSRRKPSPTKILSRPLPFVTFECRSCQRDGIGLALCGTRKMRRTPAELPTPARAQQSVAARECL